MQRFKNLLKNAIPNSFMLFYKTIIGWISHNKLKKEWESSNKENSPPHFIKQKILIEYKNLYNCEILVETGTFQGDMVYAMKDHFLQIHSIELSKKYFEFSKNRFKEKQNINLYCGDSAIMLEEICRNLNFKTLFWLDGHYSGNDTAVGLQECPVLFELKAILNNNSNKNIILIDDARKFNGTESYPTIEEIRDFFEEYKQYYNIDVKYDIIRCVPI